MSKGPHIKNDFYIEAKLYLAGLFRAVFVATLAVMSRIWYVGGHVANLDPTSLWEKGGGTEINLDSIKIRSDNACWRILVPVMA